jgi:hypothetical protein
VETPEDGAKYVLLTLPVSLLDHLDAIYELAREYKLHGFSGVADEAF